MDWRRTWLPYMQHWGTGNSIAFCWPQFQNWSIVDDALFENHKNNNGQNETGSFQYFSAEKHAALGVGENLVFLSFIKTESFLSGNLACAFSCLLFSILTIYRSFFPTRIALFHASSKFVLFSLSCSVVLFLAKHEIALDQITKINRASSLHWIPLLTQAIRPFDTIWYDSRYLELSRKIERDSS